MNKTKFLKWLRSALIRSVKSMAQTALASIGTSSVVLEGFHWKFVLMTTGMAAVGRRPTERKQAEIREKKQKKHLYCARRHAIIRGQTEERKT